MEEPDYRERLEAKLQPARIRSTLAFAGLFQLTHEMLKSTVLDDVKGFFGFLDVDGGVWLPEDGVDEYRRHVLALDTKRPFRASLLWLQEMDVITADDVARLDDIYAHRHELTHELANYLVNPDLEPNVNLLLDALKTLRKISRFWVEVEHSLGTFDDFHDLDLDEVIPGRIAILDLCIGAYGDGLES